MILRYDKVAIKFLQYQPKNLRDLIRNAINGLMEIPPKGDIKPMQGYKDGRYRLREGKYRIIYKYTNENEIDILLVLEIGSRGDIYK